MDGRFGVVVVAADSGGGGIIAPLDFFIGNDDFGIIDDV